MEESSRKKYKNLAVRLGNTAGLVFSYFAIQALLSAWFLNGFGDPYPEAVRMREIVLFPPFLIICALLGLSFLVGVFRPSLKRLLLTIVLFLLTSVVFDGVQHYIWLHFEAIHY